jgi:Ca2+-transporting ATPase
MAARAHALPAEEVAAALGVDPALGLTEREAARRLEELGANELAVPQRPPYLRLALRQLIDPLVRQ